MSTPAFAERAEPRHKARTAAPIAISGVGLVSSLGLSLPESFRNAVEGRSGATFTESAQASPGNGPIAGFPVDAARLPATGMWDDPVFGILEQALAEALTQAGKSPDRLDPARTAVVVGLSKGAVRLQSRWASDPGSIRSDPLAQALGWAGVAPSAGATYVASRIGATGPVLAPITACATGLTCLRTAAALLEQDLCDVAIAGAADASLIPMIEASFRRMRALASPHAPNEPPSGWLRPWSASRNGFLIGEGGALFVLERTSELARSGRTPLALIERFASGSEAHHATRPNGSADILGRVLRDALGPGQQAPDFIHLHATATRDYDPLEAAAVRRALGPDHRRTYVLASKPLVGHCLGAAGAVELAISCGVLASGMLHPFDPAPPFDFELVGRLAGPEAIERPLNSCLKIVAGFGGHVEACLLTRPDRADSECC